MSAPLAKTALLLAGGGARAAYQVGVLRSFARAFPEIHFPILTGISAGSINAALLASTPADLPHIIDKLAGLWEGLRIDDVFRSDFRNLSSSLRRWGCRLVSGGAPAPGPGHGLVDTGPLDRFLRRSLETPDGMLRGIDACVRRGQLSALGITTTSYPSGQSITWIQGNRAQGWEGPDHRGVPTELSVDHIMASCALPLVFPAVRLGQAWHGDGGVRLTAPLAPAIRLGAERIIAVSTLAHGGPLPSAAASPDYPTPAAIVGVLLNSIFLDTLARDAEDLRQINRLIANRGSGSVEGLRPVELMVIRPSRDLSEIAMDYEESLPRTIRHFVRGMGPQGMTRSDFIATLLFHPGYIRDVMAIGEQDAQNQIETVAAFLGLPVSGRQLRTPRRSPAQPETASDVAGIMPSAAPA